MKALEIENLISDIDVLLLDNDIETAAKVIAELFEKIKGDTIEKFYLCCHGYLLKGKHLSDFASVFQRTEIVPNKEISTCFVNAAYKEFIRIGLNEKMRVLIATCYQLLLSHNMPDFFLKLYRKTNVEPRVDLVYQAIMMARQNKLAELKEQLCSAFEILD